MKFWISVVGVVLAACVPAHAGVASPGDPQWPFWAEHAAVLTARKAPQVWKLPTEAREVAYVFDVKGARFFDDGQRPGHADVSYGYRRGVHVASWGWPLRVRYRSDAGATPLIVYWGELNR